MNVDLKVQLGLYGTSETLSPIKLDVGSVGAASSWAGSYHVLSMGRHYEDYVMTGALMSLPPITGIPPAHPYEKIAGKVRAGGITGNIGEAIAAIFARRYLLAGIEKIAHIKPRQPFKRRKSPDYLMDIGKLFPGPFSKVIPKGFSATLPDWWPVESKARSNESARKGGRLEALRQLLAYWSLLQNSQPATVGYGLIVVFRYQPTRQVRVSLLMPKNQPKLVEEIKKGYGKDRESTLRSFLHECGN